MDAAHRAILRILSRRARLATSERQVKTLLRARLGLGVLMAALLRLLATACLGGPPESAIFWDRLALATAAGGVFLADRLFASGFRLAWSEDEAVVRAFFVDFLGLSRREGDSPAWSSDLKALAREACRTGVPRERERRAALNRWSSNRHTEDRRRLAKRREVLPAFELLGIGLTIVLALAAFIPQVL